MTSTANISALEAALVNWNGKSSSDIELIYNQFIKEEDFLEWVISFLSDEKLQVGASWLLKRLLEGTGTLSNQQNNLVVLTGVNFESWQAKLHFLQILPFLTMVNDHRNQLEYFIKVNITDQNKFVRAWSYNGLYLLATRYTDLRQEAQQFFDMALKDEAASVKARIRNILKQGFIS